MDPHLTIPYGEAIFFGIWYFTILTLAVSVWVMCTAVIRIANTLDRIQQMFSNMVIARAAAGIDTTPPSTRRDDNV